MRGLLATIKRTPLPWAFVAYAVLRALVVLGKPVGRFPDTDGWLALAWWGDNERFWPVPAVLTLAGSDGVRVALHVMAGTVAWVYLAFTVARLSRFPRTTGLVTLAVGLTPQVTRWDLAILSESLSITFTVAAIAATIRLATGAGSLVAWMCLTSLVGLTRPTHLVVVFAIAAVAAVSTARSRLQRHAIPALVFVAVSIWGVVLLDGNSPTSRLNIYTVLANDVAPSDERWSWFVDEGMPAAPGAREATGYDFAGALPDDLASIVDLPVGQQPPAIVRAGGVALAEWVRDEGVTTLARWIITHPAESLGTLADRADATLSPPNDDFLPLETRQVMPRLLFGPWEVWAGLWAAAALLATLRRRAARDVRTIAAMGVSVAVVYGITMLFSGIEHQRHAATVATAVRVVALASFALAIPKKNDVSQDQTPPASRGART